ncbi:hypothetical protein EYF80_031202 [Liparis tanakae]|uniref:Uncharacterized protein n=1 Tax=Liparis tanakae TaxID=230148 RepID=A0A4Z2H113_9TELE|nr:hypothetical protein EYF80_031202 [Liparis tanakae]
MKMCSCSGFERAAESMHRGNNAAIDTDPHLQPISPPPGPSSPSHVAGVRTRPRGPRMRFRCRTLLFPISEV